MPTLEINLEPLLALADDPIAASWYLISHGGWIFVLIAFIWMSKWLWIYHIQFGFMARKLKPVLLAIDVPKLTVQTPKGVENIFAHLAGAHGSHNRRERYWHGNVQEWFSLEIISIEGYTQFLIWTWDRFRDLVETAIYAQYPDAQITEVQDYTTEIPTQYPNKEWDLFGTEFVLVKPNPYPIRTWEFFEHKGQKDEPFKDPLAALLENMARIGPGEQIWLQILIMPMDQDWQKDGAKLVKKLIGAKMPAKKTALDTIIETTGKITSPILEQVIGPTEAPPKRDEPPSQVLYLSAGEREVVELIEKKISKIGFKTKIRAIYVARHEVFKKPRGAHAVIGAIKQFNTNNANALKPEYQHISPASIFWFAKARNNARRRKLVRAYRTRNMWMGMPAAILNIEELATMWHFPTVAVHSPLIKKTEAKRAEPPTGLPVAAASPPPVLTAKELPEVKPPEGIPIT